MAPPAPDAVIMSLIFNLANSNAAIEASFWSNKTFALGALKYDNAAKRLWKFVLSAKSYSAASKLLLNSLKVLYYEHKQLHFY